MGLKSKILILVVFLGVIGSIFTAIYLSGKALAAGLAEGSSENYVSAEQKFRSAIRWNPWNLDAYVELSISLERQDKFQEAYAVLSQAERRFGSGNLRLKSEKGKIARYLGNLDEAERLLNEVIGERPQDGLAHFRLGHVYYDRKNYQRAKQEYETAVRLFPENAQFRSSLGAVLITLGDLEGAKREILKAIQIDPEFPNAYNNLADILKREGEYDRALYYVGLAINLNPRKAEFYMTKAEIYEALGDKEKAQAAYENALRLLNAAFPSGHTLKAEIEKRLEALGE